MNSIILFVSVPEIAVILLFIVVFFGSKKIPQVARSLGKAIREIKDASDEIKKEIQESSTSIEEEINKE